MFWAQAIPTDCRNKFSDAFRGFMGISLQVTCKISNLREAVIDTVIVTVTPH